MGAHDAGYWFFHSNVLVWPEVWLKAPLSWWMLDPSSYSNRAVIVPVCATGRQTGARELATFPGPVASLLRRPVAAPVPSRREVVGEPVDGNKIWYRLRDRVGGQLAWVTARWVRNTGRVPASPPSPRLTRQETAPVEQNTRQESPLG
ncbi:hypothetical protein [Streptomyces sp. ICBB 8177]|uniref:hypothetical protein n=1 Tax=Streptomyces sp. ICBB 8177 TaxID=563922 RepID=UPI000D67FCA1|nr:hypothetical protein [Streptomyces sp. ICBB 8177]PWI45837.1 hypothetical protein CK485_01355 [Streptomyces sp. ICBB 8177]